MASYGSSNPGGVGGNSTGGRRSGWLDTVLTDNSQGANQNPSGQQNTTQAGSSSQPQLYDYHRTEPNNCRELAAWLVWKKSHKGRNQTATNLGISHHDDACVSINARRILLDFIVRNRGTIPSRCFTPKGSVAFSHIRITEQLIEAIRNDSN